MSTCCSESMNGRGHGTDCPAHGAEVQRLKRMEELAAAPAPRQGSKHARARAQRARARHKKRRK